MSKEKSEQSTTEPGLRSDMIPPIRKRGDSTTGVKRNGGKTARKRVYGGCAFGARSVLGLAGGKKGELLSGLVGGGGVRVVSFDLLIEAHGLRRIGLLVMRGESKEDNGFGNEDGGILQELVIKLDGLLGLAGLVINLGEFEFGHGSEVAIGTFLQRSERGNCLNVLAQMRFTESFVIQGELAGAGLRILAGDGLEFGKGGLIFLRVVGIRGDVGLRGLAGGDDGRGVNPHRVVECRFGLYGLALGIKAPSENSAGDDEDGDDDVDDGHFMGEDGFGAVGEQILDLIGFQFLTGDMLRLFNGHGFTSQKRFGKPMLTQNTPRLRRAGPEFERGFSVNNAYPERP